jgi:hypothetical protein|tara:strand:+ start:323 stop:508 length:186 start_codon:yes stop_codon:yes gene_type:complete
MEVNPSKLIVDTDAVCRNCLGNGYLRDLNYRTQMTETINCFFCNSSGKETVLVFKKEEHND